MIALDIRPTQAIIGSEDDPMVRSGRPITLPGLWGRLAEQEGGVGALARKLGLPERSFRNYATNTRPMNAIAAAKADDLGGNEFAQVYITPRHDDIHIASVTEGWVQWPAVRGGWVVRTAWRGDPTKLKPGSDAEARRHGWPW